jgi:tetratricopeptide (TPR) repeat protein
MPKPEFVPFSVALLASLLALAACDSPEERAESHYRRGLELLADGNDIGARIEFRNALQQNRGHAAARLEFARALAAAGDVHGAIGHYLRVVEQDDRNGPAHLELVQLAVSATDHHTASRHARRAFELMPEDPLARAYMATVEFREGDRAAAVAMAEAVLAEAAGNIPARFVLIADRMERDDFGGALALADAALALAPDSRDLNLARLSALEEIGNAEAVGLQLQRMEGLFPDDREISQTLVGWHLARSDADAAVGVLRGIAARDPTDPQGHLNVAQLLLQTKGPAAARAELRGLVETQPDPAPFLRALAQLDFADGRQAEAIAALRALTEDRDPNSAAADLQITLAAMLLQTGQGEEAAALVDTVLAGDDRHVEALKLRARRFIAADRPERALQDLDVALTEAPHDPEIMTIMAAAHAREGAHDLVGRRLARAVEAAAFAPGESLRYARFLLSDSRPGPAESTLLDALRRAPENLELLGALGHTHVSRGDGPRARQVVETMRGLGGPDATRSANALELSILQAEGRADDIVAMLDRLEDAGDVGARLGLARAHLAVGDTAAARAKLAPVLEEDPTSMAGRLLLAQTNAAEGETRAAEKLYRDLVAEAPPEAAAYEGLFTLLAGDGRADEARAVLEAGLAATGRNGPLLNRMVEVLVADGDFAGAIAILEELYARDSSDVAVANNLASLISTYRDDDESIERAFQVARRLRGTRNPFFQDTYGWILTRRGDSRQALNYLEPAAAELTDDPLTQVHLGMTYFALERWNEARAALARGVDAAGPDSRLPQIAQARERIAEIDAREMEASGG